MKINLSYRSIKVSEDSYAFPDYKFTIEFYYFGTGDILRMEIPFTEMSIRYFSELREELLTNEKFKNDFRENRFSGFILGPSSSGGSQKVRDDFIEQKNKILEEFTPSERLLLET